MLPSRLPEREALAQFVRSRRQRAAPSPARLRSNHRRATGLRREELAQLAGVSISWYTWFEQGRDIRVSDAFLDKLSQALSLDPGERQHLFLLAQHRPPAASIPLATSATDVLQRIVDSHPNPVYVKNLRWDVLAWNRPASIMFGDYGALPESERNALWLVFRNPAYRTLLVQWDDDARDLVARFRADLGRLGDDERAASLVQELRSTSPEFDRCWNSHDITWRGSGIRCFRHHTAGVIEFQHTRLSVDGTMPDPLRMLIFTPLPGENARRAARLFGTCRQDGDSATNPTVASLAS